MELVLLGIDRSTQKVKSKYENTRETFSTAYLVVHKRLLFRIGNQERMVRHLAELHEQVSEALPLRFSAAFGFLCVEAKHKLTFDAEDALVPKHLKYKSERKNKGRTMKKTKQKLWTSHGATRGRDPSGNNKMNSRNNEKSGLTYQQNNI